MKLLDRFFTRRVKRRLSELRNEHVVLAAKCDVYKLTVQWLDKHCREQANVLEIYREEIDAKS